MPLAGATQSEGAPARNRIARIFAFLPNLILLAVLILLWQNRNRRQDQIW